MGTHHKGAGSWQHDYTTRLRVIDEEFVHEFARAASRVLGTRPTKVWLDKKTGLWQTDVNSMLLYRFLNKPFGELKTFIEHCKECTAAFIRGFFDAEAGVGTRSFSIAVGNRELIIYVQNLLKEYFLIDSTGPYQRGPPPGTTKVIKGSVVRVNMYTYAIRINAKSLKAFQGMIGFTLLRKKDALRNLVESRGRRK